MCAHARVPAGTRWHQTWVKVVAAGPSYFASADMDGVVVVWDLATCAHVRTLERAHGGITSA